MPREKYFTQTILFKTYLPRGGWAVGRWYYMMQDVDGRQYLARVREDGTPDLTEE